MRTIIRASAAVLVLDSRDKSPIRGASVLVDGGRGRCVGKGGGYFVLVDFPEGEHGIEVSAPGFRTLRRTVRTETEPRIQAAVMQYAPDSPWLRGVSHYRFRFARGGAPLRDSWVRVALLTGCGALRVVGGVKKGGRRLALSGGYAPALLHQDYETEGVGAVALTGYDWSSGRWELRERLRGALAEGAALRPRWTLETDREGVAVLPFVGLFMEREELEFSFAIEGAQEKRLTLPPPAGAYPAAVEFREAE